MYPEAPVTRQRNGDDMLSSVTRLRRGDHGRGGGQACALPPARRVDLGVPRRLRGHSPGRDRDRRPAPAQSGPTWAWIPGELSGIDYRLRSGRDTEIGDGRNWRPGKCDEHVMKCRSLRLVPDRGQHAGEAAAVLYPPSGRAEAAQDSHRPGDDDFVAINPERRDADRGRGWRHTEDHHPPAMAEQPDAVSIASGTPSHRPRPRSVPHRARRRR